MRCASTQTSHLSPVFARGGARQVEASLEIFEVAANSPNGRRTETRVLRLALEVASGNPIPRIRTDASLIYRPIPRHGDAAPSRAARFSSA